MKYFLTLIAAAALVACNSKSGDPLKLAQDSLSQGDTAAAVISLKSALQAQGERGDLRLLLGKTLLEAGDAQSAAIELEKALASGQPATAVVPSLATALLRDGKLKILIDRFADQELDDRQAQASLLATLATAYWMNERRQLAAGALERSLELDPKQSEALLLKANITAVNGEFVQALAELEKLLEHHPGHLQALLLKSNVQAYGLQQTEAAAETLKQALQAEPRFVEAHKGLILHYMASGKSADAHQQLKRLREIAPRHPGTYYLSGLLAYHDGDTQQARAAIEPLLKKAPDFVGLQHLSGLIEARSGNLVKAESHLAKAANLAPDNLAIRLALAGVYVSLGKSERALLTLEPAMQHKPPVVQALSMAADIHLRNGDLGKAQALYATAVRESPKAFQPQVALAQLKIQQGQLDTGLRELQVLSNASPPHETHAELALYGANVKNKDYKEAIAVADRLAAKQPNSAGPLLLRTYVLEHLQDAVGAQAALTEAIRREPLNFAATRRLADYDAHRGDFTAAIKRFDRILKDQPDQVDARLAVIELLRRKGESPDQLLTLLTELSRQRADSVAAWAALIKEQNQQKRLADALQSAQSATSRLPNSPVLRLALGDALSRNGKREQALSTFRDLALSEPGDPYIQYRLAEIWLEEKQRTAAVTALQKAISLRPNYLPAQRALAALELQAGRFTAALRIADTIQKQRPKESIGHLIEGDIESSRKAWGPAIKAFRQALERNPNDGEAAIKLHVTLLNAGQTEEAGKFAGQRLATQTEEASFPSHLAELAIRDKRYAEAESLLKQAVQRGPHRAPDWNSLAQVQLQLKKPALEAAQEAVKRDQSNAIHLQTLAQAHSANGQHQEALNAQAKAISMADQEPNTRLIYAKLLLAAGKPAEARRELQALVSNQREFAGRAEADELLRRAP